MDELRATSRVVRCTALRTEVRRAGDVYTLAAGVFHTTDVASGEETATVVFGQTLDDGTDLSLGPVEGADPHGATPLLWRGRNRASGTYRCRSARRNGPARLIGREWEVPVAMRTLVLPVRAEIDRALGVAVDAAEAAGTLLRERAGSSFTVRSKGAGDVVTDLDLASERLIIERITAAFPTHQIVAEEAGVVDPSSDDDWVWLVDPLDGTNNVAMGLPAYVVGVALCHHREPVVGVVHDPIGGKTFTAVRGSGAFGPHGVLSTAAVAPAHPAWAGHRLDPGPHGRP